MILSKFQIITVLSNTNRLQLILASSNKMEAMKYEYDNSNAYIFDLAATPEIICKILSFFSLDENHSGRRIQTLPQWKFK